MIWLADASVEASKVEHCSTFEASNAGKAKRRNHNAVRQSVTSWMGRSVEASTHAALWTGRYSLNIYLFGGGHTTSMGSHIQSLFTHKLRPEICKKMTWRQKARLWKSVGAFIIHIMMPFTHLISLHITCYLKIRSIIKIQTSSVIFTPANEHWLFHKQL